MLMLPKYAIISAVAAVAAITSGLVMFAAPVEAASADGEPTMFVNGINANQSNAYIYNVPVGSDEFRTALMIKDLEEKANVQLVTVDPFGVVTVCPLTPAAFALLHSECTFMAPAAGIWTISIVSGAVGNVPLGYAIAADTRMDGPPPGGGVGQPGHGEFDP